MSSSHPWFDLVVGGVDKPRIAIIRGENLCSNPRFITSTTGWTFQGGNGSLTRVENGYSYDAYCGKINYTANTLSYAQYIYNMSSGNSQGKKYAVAFRLWNNTSDDYKIKVQVYAGTEKLAEYKLVTNKNAPIRVGFITEESTVASTQIKINIYGSDEIVPAGNPIYFDDVYLFTISDGEDYILPYPHDTHLLFEKYVQGENELWDGKIQEFNKKWKPYFYADYLYFDKNSELNRNYISEASQLFVMPHSDFLWAFLGIWDDDFDQKYSFMRYFGHESGIKIKGTEWMLEKIPRTIEYIPPPVLVGIGFFTSPVYGVRIYLDHADYYGHVDGITVFTRHYEEGDTLRMIAPATFSKAGVDYTFVRWTDGALELSTNRDMTVTVSIMEIEYWAIYQPVVPIVETGYGTDYGGMTQGYGVVL